MDFPKRKLPRLPGYDYSTPGAYFVTICTHNKQKILSRIVGAMISNAIGYLKMNASRDMHKNGYTEKIWQRSFYDHIIRNDEDYKNIWQYIYGNPSKWLEDCFYCE